MGRSAADRSMSFFELRDAMALPGCPVCRLKFSSAARFLDGMLLESVNDPQKRRKIRRARGFCHEHSWALARASASLGVAIILHDVFGNLLETLDRALFDALPVLSWRRVQEGLDAGQPSAATAELLARLEPETACPACEWAEKMESMYLDVLLGSLVDEERALESYASSDGLCFPHFRQALARVRKRTAFDALVNAQRAIWTKLVDQLDESIRKSDYRRLGETWGKEAGAWLRAIAALAGARPDDKGRRDENPAWSFRRPKQVDTSEK